VEIFARSYDAICKIINRYSKFLHKLDNKEQVSVYYLYRGSNGSIESPRQLIKTSEKSNIINELYPDVDVEDLSTEFQTSDDSILILQGQPGVGKTMFIKLFLINHAGRTVAYCKDEKLMTSGSFWPYMIHSSYNTLVLDDLDFSLARRDETDEQSSSFISNLLSYSDGLFNSEERKKVIISSNQPFINMDPAICRPGRCFDFIELRPLEYEYALHVWQTTLGNATEDFYRVFGTDRKTISQAYIMTEHKKLSRSKITRSYIKSSVEARKSAEERLKEAGILGKERNRVGF
jgi:SpoVK/Ycf46/Vps4 family AAA+-type ATPase